MADVKWIKITTDIFDDEKILLIESMPDSYAMITVWFKLLCLAGKQNNCGVFTMGQIAYTDKMLATIFRMKESTVTMALQTFEQFGMVKIIDGVITIPNWEKHQSLDVLEQAKEKTRQRVARHREKQKLLAEGNVTRNATVTFCNADRIDKERDKDKEGDIEGENNIILPDSDEPAQTAPKKAKPAKHKYGEFKHVLLTDAEYGKLAEEYGTIICCKAINFLDAYIEEKGYKSKSHYLAIRRWVIDAVKDRDKAQPKSQVSRASSNPFLDIAKDENLF